MKTYEWKAVLIAAVGSITLWLTAQAQAQAQDTNAPRTELGVFEAKVNMVVVKGTAEMGSVQTSGGSVSVRCKEFIDPNSGRKQLGLGITLTGRERQVDSTLIDYAELTSLVSSLDFLASANWSLTSLPDFDATYTTRDGFTASVYSSRRQPGTTGIALQSNRTIPVRIMLAPDQFAQFRTLIQQAKTKLDGLPAGK